MAFTLIERGAPNSTEYRLFMLDDNDPISPLHDIPFAVDADNNIYNVIVLGPRWSNAKMNVCMRESLNPIGQELKKGNLRYIPNCFPHHGYIWNYCMIPQTWKSNELLDDGTGQKGDSLPMEVIEIGQRVAVLGEVLQVKFLGTIALRGESSWKVVAIDINDPLADEIHELSDIVKHCPGLMKGTLEWLKLTQIADGKPDNRQGYGGEVRGIGYTQNIVKEYNTLWRQLILNEVPSNCIACINTTVADSPYYINGSDGFDYIELSPPLTDPLPIAESVDKWHFIQLK